MRFITLLGVQYVVHGEICFQKFVRILIGTHNQPAQYTLLYHKRVKLLVVNCPFAGPIYRKGIKATTVELLALGAHSARSEPISFNRLSPDYSISKATFAFQ